MLYRNRGKMRLIFHHKVQAAPEDGLDIIVLPAPFAVKLRESCSWLKPLSAATQNDTRVYYYDYRLQADNSTLWRQLLSHGHFLLETLSTIRNTPSLHRRPIVFIAHSLGGIIIKRALSLANQEGSVIEHALCGIIFLGTPHLVSLNDPRWSRWPLMMRSPAKDAPKVELGKFDIPNLAAACQDFQAINLQSPILSIYEGLEKRTRDNVLDVFKRSRMLFVDQDLARVGAQNEDLQRVEANHDDLIRVPVNGLLYDKIVKFFKVAAEEGPEGVAEIFKQLRLEESTTQTSASLRSSSRKDQTNTLAVDITDLDNQTPLALLDLEKIRVVQRLPLRLLSGAQRNPIFLGRADIMEEMDKVLLPSNTSTELDDRVPKSFALCGMGGIGKTEIACQYVHTRKHLFDAVFWVSAETERKLALGFREISRELGLEDPATGLSDEVVTRGIVHGWLSKPLKVSGSGPRPTYSDASWLLVFDNADDEDLLFDWWPSTGVGSIIITSRDPLTKDSPIAETTGVDVSPLSVEDGGLLLEQVSRSSKQNQGAVLCQKISHTLGGLPLALIQMGSVIRRNHYSLGEFIEFYEKSSGKFQSAQLSGVRLAYRHTLSSVWAIEALPPHASALLRVISIMDADKIQEKMLTEATAYVSMEDYPKTMEEYVDARYQLLRASLISRNVDERELRIHRLVQEVTREKMTLNELAEVLEAAVTLVLAIWPVTKTILMRNRAWRYPIFDAYLPHISKWGLIYADKIKSGQIKPGIDTAILFNDAAWSIIERSFVDKVPPLLLSLAHATLETIDPAGDEELEKTKSRQMGYYHHYKSLEAQDHGLLGVAFEDCKEALRIVIDRVEKWNDPADTKDLADIYNTTGILEILHDKVDVAIRNWHLAYDAFREAKDMGIFGPTWPAISLSAVYVLKGQPDKGEEYLGPVLSDREKELGENDKTSSETGAQWRMMGHIRIGQGRSEEGLRYHERALENLVATRGEYHYETGDCCYNIAQDHLRAGDVERASSFLDRAITVYGNIAPRDENMARALWKKGRVLKKLGQTAAAQPYLDRAMDIRRRIDPSDDREEQELMDQDWDKLLFYFSR
ncbi:hypothetical protein QQZ08_009613 [Neonectria magnoliae]|uniref:NB-ARC domain-containing protein n=1 Tax=Neonectria magnoliae TaxID=2732573 RepID=A0ABR1HLQ1_9HYPO